MAPSNGAATARRRSSSGVQSLSPDTMTVNVTPTAVPTSPPKKPIVRLSSRNCSATCRRVGKEIDEKLGAMASRPRARGLVRGPARTGPTRRAAATQTRSSKLRVRRRPTFSRFGSHRTCTSQFRVRASDLLVRPPARRAACRYCSAHENTKATRPSRCSSRSTCRSRSPCRRRHSISGLRTSRASSGPCQEGRCLQNRHVRRPRHSIFGCISATSGSTSRAPSASYAVRIASTAESGATHG